MKDKQRNRRVNIDWDGSPALQETLRVAMEKHTSATGSIDYAAVAREFDDPNITAEKCHYRVKRFRAQAEAAKAKAKAEEIARLRKEKAEADARTGSSSRSGSGES